MTWEQNGLMLTVFGRGGLLTRPPTPTCAEVLAKRFLHDAKRRKLGGVAFVGLIQPSIASEGESSDTTAMCSTLSVDIVGSVSDQAALESMLSKFVDVFEKPG